MHFPQVVIRPVRHKKFIAYPDFPIFGDCIKYISQYKSYLLWTLWKENKVIRYEQQLWMFLQQCFCHQEWNTRIYHYSFPKFYTNKSNTAAWRNSSRFAQASETAIWCPLSLGPKKFIHYCWVRVLLDACVRKTSDEYIMYLEAHYVTVKCQMSMQRLRHLSEGAVIVG